MLIRTHRNDVRGKSLFELATEYLYSETKCVEYFVDLHHNAYSERSTFSPLNLNTHMK